MAQNVTVAGASYSAVPSVDLPTTGGGTSSFYDVSDTTATAADVAQGKTFHLASGVAAVGTASNPIATIEGTYTAATKALALSTDGTIADWWGGVGYELMGDVQWSAAISSAANWPLTPTTSAQNLTWTTSITTTANANATIDRIGKGYHGVTATLDFGTYNYIFFEDCYVHYEYTSPEASLGKVHTIYDGFTSVYFWGARPRIASGAIVRPDATHYGTYGACTASASLIGYRTAAGAFQLANNSTYGVGVAGIAPSMNSTSSVKPSYFNVRTPTVSIRAHNTYMPVASYSSLDMDATTVHFRCRVYRVPLEYGMYTEINDRLLDMLQDETFPVEV